jgi:hypothetical protein
MTCLVSCQEQRKSSNFWYTRHFTLLIDGQNPCCEILREESVEKWCTALCPFYTVYCPFHCLAASLRRFMPVQCEHSEAHERKTREKPLPRAYDVFMPVTTPPLRSSRRHRDAGFPIIYLDLSVRLKKQTFFSRFRTENCRFFCVFPTFFFPPPGERTRIMYTGKYRNRRRIRRFVTGVLQS